jgi:hypothetical protein
MKCMNFHQGEIFVVTKVLKDEVDNIVNQLVRDQKQLCNKMLLLILPWILSVIFLKLLIWVIW